MFKTLAISVISILFCFNSAFSQNAKNDLTENADALYREGKFEKAIEAAEKVVKMEESEQRRDFVSYVNALINLARMKNDYVWELRIKTGNSNTSVSERVKLRKKISEIAAGAEKLYRQALEINEINGREQTAQTADLKKDLAVLVDSFNPEPPSVENSRARIDEAEKFFTESLSISEQVRGKDDNKTLSIVQQLGYFYLKYVNFEKALSFYERYIETYERMSVKKHPVLRVALEPYAWILFATFQDSEASEVVKRVEEIMGTKGIVKSNSFNFHLRSKDSVEHSVRLSQSYREKTEIFRAKLIAEGRTLNGNNIDLAPKLINVAVNVVVDENGKVIEAVTDSYFDEKLRARAEQEVSKWTVRPFSHKGVTRKMRGHLVYSEVQ